MTSLSHASPTSRRCANTPSHTRPARSAGQAMPTTVVAYFGGGVVQLELCFEMSGKFTANHCSGPGRVIGPANVCLSENSRLMPVRSDAAFSSNLSLTVNVNCQSLRLHENCSFS